MTINECTNKRAYVIPKLKASNAAIFITFITLTILLICNHDIIRTSVESSVKMCISTILPSIFPFMILSDYLLGNLSVNKSSGLSAFFSKCFNINGVGIWPFIIGNICGFPLGTKASIDLYNRGAITKKECERLIGFANNPSLAFIVSGVGMGMRHSIRDGIYLYSAVVISSCVLGVVTRGKEYNFLNSNEMSKQNYSFVDSIKNSLFAVISVCSYIIFFSMVADIIMPHIESQIISLVLASMLEISTATNLIAKSNIPEQLSLPMTAFALGFSGLSVYLQTLSFAPKDINKFSCLLMKLLQGIIAFLIAAFCNILL